MRGIVWLLRLPFRLIRRFATFFAVLALIASLVFNVATLTVTGVYAAASGALSAVGVTTVAAREAGARMTRRKAAQKIGRETAQSVSRRVQRSAARNIASVGGEAIPFVGIAVIAGALALEVRDACDTAADMAGLEAALAAEQDAETVRAATVEAFDCTTLIPEYDNLPDKAELWATIKASPAKAYASARAHGIALSEVDWSGQAAGAVEWLIGWADGMRALIWPEEKDSAQ